VSIGLRLHSSQVVAVAAAAAAVVVVVAVAVKWNGKNLLTFSCKRFGPR